MEIVEFKKVLSKALNIVDIGIQKGYFEENKREELNRKLQNILNNGIVYDLPGTAIYGIYSYDEKKLSYNVKVFKSEEEALVYILHEMKHGLDHYDDIWGFQYQNTGVGMQEGATQRFATDMAEEILSIKFPRIMQSSLKIQFNTYLDEYQIEDKLNEMFCIALGISMEDFIKIQNDPQKEELKKLIKKFNRYASYETFKRSLDEIYKIQEENWIDKQNYILEREEEPTDQQASRAMESICCCKQMCLRYAQEENPEVVNQIQEMSFQTTNEFGENFYDDFESSWHNDTMSEEEIVYQADYLNYQQTILNQIGSSVLNNECSIIFVSEFNYDSDNCDKIIYFQKGNSYQKMIIPMREDGTMDMINIRIQKVDDVYEIEDYINDCNGEFGVIANGPEYAKILNMTGQTKKAQHILEQWKYYLSKQDELEQIRSMVETEKKNDFLHFQSLVSMLNSSSNSVSINDDTLQNNNDSVCIEYENILIFENQIMTSNPSGSINLKLTPEEEEQCISRVKTAVENGDLLLNESQQILLNSYIHKKTK